MVKIKAKTGCKFGYEGTMYRFNEGEEKEVDVPIEKIDTHNFEIVGEKTVERKSKKKEKLKETEGGAI